MGKMMRTGDPPEEAGAKGNKEEATAGGARALSGGESSPSEDWKKDE